MPRRRAKNGGARKGAGRPSLGADARSETIRVRVTPRTLEAVKAAAGAAEQSLSDWGHEAIQLAIARGSTR